jgi:hypothetical protein
VFIYVLCAVILAFQQQSNTMKLEILGFLMLYSRILSSIFLLERLKSASVSQIPYSSQLTAQRADYCQIPLFADVLNVPKEQPAHTRNRVEKDFAQCSSAKNVIAQFVHTLCL